MADSNLFLPLTKVDAAKRLVYGVVTAEAPDRGDEICDYASTKPYYEKWSSEVLQASGGKSHGNVRAMHGKIAAGRVEAIHFDDAAKQIEICAKIIDESEWAKVEAGVYTGFSQGGGYVKRWPDAEDPKFTRYTARPSEISLVDLPCLPNATFTLIKADGAQETHAFALHKAAGLVDQVWAARDGATFKKKADAIAHQARLVDDQTLQPVALREARHEQLGSLLGQEGLDSDRAIRALGFVFKLLQDELTDNERDPDKINSLKESIGRLHDFTISQLSEGNSLAQAAAPSALAKIETELSLTRSERDSHKSSLDALLPKLDKLARRVEEIGREPLPPPLLAGTRAVEKGGERRTDDLAAILAAMSADERAALLIKVAQSQPQRFG